MTDLANALFQPGPKAPRAWDIVTFALQSARSGECGVGTPGTPCEGTVTIGDKCYFQEEANYLLYGMSATLLADKLKAKGVKRDLAHEGWVAIGFHAAMGALATSKPILDLARNAGTNGRRMMYQAGLDMSADKLTIPKDPFDSSVANCAPCKGQYTSTILIGPDWLPPDIEPRLHADIGKHAAGFPEEISVDIGPQLPVIHRIGQPDLP